MDFFTFHLGQRREIASGLTEVSHQVVHVGRVRPEIQGLNSEKVEYYLRKLFTWVVSGLEYKA